MRRLPPFPELVAFEAVARHLSFTRAAAELCVTQSAVSHRVRRLETHFGTPLLQRLNPGLALTEAGLALLPSLIESLDLLSRLGTRPERRLRVAAGSALCHWWLAGRLPAFMAARPGLSVELLPVESESAVIPPVDVRILWVGPDDGGASATQAPLFNEQVFPVCSPRLLPNQRPLRDAQAFGALPLLHKASNATGEWSWPLWLDRLGIAPEQRRGPVLSCADMSLVLAAAVEGAGVALSRSLLVHDALRSGRLVLPLAGVEPMRSTKQHVARWRRDRAGDADIVAFVNWLTTESSATLAATGQWLQAPAR